MLCEHVSLRDLEIAFQPHMTLPAWPGLEPGNRERAQQLARQLGVWDDLGARIDARPPIQILPRSQFREYARTGQRVGYESLFFAFQRRTNDAALALWLEHPAADLDLLQDLLWYWCEMTTWTIPACEYVDQDFHRNLELITTGVGVSLSEILFLVGDKLEPEVRERLGHEIDARILEPAHDYRRPHWWATCDLNWNSVCNANLIQTALYRIPRPDHLAKFILPLLHRLDYALNGFTADGGCLEGPDYWDYGFGHYVQAAVAMYQRTGGAVDLMADPRVEAICRYPLAVYLAPPLRTSFADGGHGYISVQVALAINRFRTLPQLLALTRPRSDGLADARSWRELALYDGRPRPAEPELADAVLPVMGQARMSANAGMGQVSVAALAGRNDVPHSHNDIGSFMLLKHGQIVLTDPGKPVYTADTFGPKRYEIIQCRSLGHNVPLINGWEQQAGEEYFGVLSVENLASDGRAKPEEKLLRIDMSNAYPDVSLRKLLRTLTLNPDGSLRLIDEYAFSRKPQALEEGFVTFEPVTVEEDGQSVLIRTGAASVQLTATGEAGRFRLEERRESAETDQQSRILHRIVFTPAKLARKMTLSFLIE